MGTRLIARATTLVASVALSAGLLMAGPVLNAAPVAADTDSLCYSEYLYSIPQHSSKHLPLASAMFKDGPGPLTVTVSVTQSGSVGFTGTVSGGATVNGIVAQAKIEVTASSTVSSSVTVGHTVQKSVGAGLYLHSEYGSWGNAVTWKYWHQDLNCYLHLVSSNTAKIPTTVMGWNFYSTTY